jgi:N-acetylneuraminate synthase
VARQRDERLQIGTFSIASDAPTFIIAEIGINHNGQLSIAKKLIDAAVEAQASCAKFQIRNLKKLYHNAGDANDIRENLGSQYALNLLSRFQLTEAEIIEAFDYCKARGILPCVPRGTWIACNC